jgi:hypothetical protein
VLIWFDQQQYWSSFFLSFSLLAPLFVFFYRLSFSFRHTLSMYFASFLLAWGKWQIGNKQNRLFLI